MEKQIIIKLHKNFEDCAHEKDGVEFCIIENRKNRLN